MLTNYSRFGPVGVSIHGYLSAGASGAPNQRKTLFSTASMPPFPALKEEAVAYGNDIKSVASVHNFTPSSLFGGIIQTKAESTVAGHPSHSRAI